MNEPMNLIAGDQPTTCAIDGRRTEWLGKDTDRDGQAYDIERCSHCSRIYHVYQPDDDDGDAVLAQVLAYAKTRWVWDDVSLLTELYDDQYDPASDTPKAFVDAQAEHYDLTDPHTPWMG